MKPTTDLDKLSTVARYQLESKRLIPPVDLDWEYVYIIEAISTDRVKIGQTKKPNKRLEALRTDCPFPTKPLLIMAIPNVYEYILHKVFHEYRLHGEWFEKVNPIMEFVRDSNNRTDAETYHWINAHYPEIVEEWGHYTTPVNPKFYKYLTLENARP